ncbi:MAG: glycosyltransferase family 2 protein [Spirochaetaceae bacterium]|nr:glycosyltransferase family 2 protein [Spirochaetaceae bacterium]
MQPPISIITPNYNCGRFIAQTIESVRTQTYTNWEMLIVDDCSTDDSYQIALEYAQKDPRIKVFQNEKNSGAAISRNKAIELSQGEYLAFLDSDDLWLPEKLEKQLQFMQENDCDFSFTEYEHIDEDNNSLLKVAKVIKKLSYKKMLFHCFPGCLTVMYNQKKIGKIYAQDIKKNNDNALFYPVLKKCSNALGINECLALYRIRQGSISRNKLKMIKPYITVLHDFEGHNLFFSYLCVLTHFFIKILFKYRSISSQESLCGRYNFLN